jgi:hypothetical protein
VLRAASKSMLNKKKGQLAKDKKQNDRFSEAAHEEGPLSSRVQNSRLRSQTLGCHRSYTPQKSR